MTLWPIVAILPKVLQHGHRNQPIFLTWYEPPPAQSASKLLCPVQALAAYIEATAAIQQIDQLFVYNGNQYRGHALFRQRLSHWIVDSRDEIEQGL